MSSWQANINARGVEPHSFPAVVPFESSATPRLAAKRVLIRQDVR